jgi:MerR family transcriptional regulator, light-induced transcriptional regulator
MEDAARFRIGELSYRVGVSPDVLRAWERRYALLRPERSEGGYRLYSERDEWRVRLMQQKLWTGLSTGEAAREVLRMEENAERPDGGVATPAELVEQLGDALESFDEDGAHEVLDLLLGLHGLERAIRDALMPYLADVGDRWARRDLSVAQEHFASRLIEGRMLALARGWNRGPGHGAVLACPSGEEHTLPLVCFGLAMRNRGWRNVYLGADTPLSSVRLAADTVGADVVVLSAVTIDRFVPVERELAGLAASHRVVLAGRGAGAELAAQLDLECIHDDPVSAAEMLSRRLVLS